MTQKQQERPLNLMIQKSQPLLNPKPLNQNPYRL